MVTGIFQFPADSVATGRHNSGASFVAGPENWMLQQTLDSFLLSPEAAARPTFASPSPVVIWGPSGTGKTTILAGVAEYWARQRPEYQLIAVHANDWARGSDIDQQNSNEPPATVAPAAECSAVALDEHRASALFIDDVQQLAGRAAAQLRLIHTLDQLHHTGGQALLTCRSHPAATSGLSARLVSRMMGGLTLPISTPGKSARSVIVEEFARRAGWRLNRAAADYAAEEINGSVRELRQALAQCFPVRPLSTESLGVEQIKSHLEVLSQRGVAAQDVLSLVARHYGVTIACLKSASRRRNVVLARSVAMLILRRTTKMPLKKVGALFGGRDHTTVIHACRKIEQQLPHDTDLNQFLREAVTALRLRHSHTETCTPET